MRRVHVDAVHVEVVGRDRYFTTPDYIPAGRRCASEERERSTPAPQRPGSDVRAASNPFGQRASQWSLPRRRPRAVVDPAWQARTSCSCRAANPCVVPARPRRCLPPRRRRRRAPSCRPRRRHAPRRQSAHCHVLPGASEALPEGLEPGKGCETPRPTSSRARDRVGSH